MQDTVFLGETDLKLSDTDKVVYRMMSIYVCVTITKCTR